MPCPCGVQTVMLAVCGRAATSVPWPRYQVCICTFRLGQAASAIQRPGLCRCVVAGEREVSSQIRKAAGETVDAAAGAAAGVSPAPPPFTPLLQKADGRTGHGILRVDMRPGSDQALGWHLEMGQQAEYGVRVAIRPTSHG